MTGVETRLLRHPELARRGSELASHVDSWLAQRLPRDLAGLFDSACIGLLREAIERVGGCEGTIWLSDGSSGSLVAVYNSGVQADALVGFEQPIGSGIISMVHSQQQPYCENEIKANHGHDDTLDRKIQKHTVAMIAVPFYFALGLRGVISCVQLEEDLERGSERGFSSRDVDELACAANLMERLINETIWSSALGLSDVG
jgi:hypothetical protein